VAVDLVDGGMGASIGRSMRLLDWFSAGATVIEKGLADSGRNAVYLRHLLRGNQRHARHRCAARSPGDSRPVLLVPGYMATRGSLHLLEARLGELGHVVMGYPTGVAHLGDIRKSAALLGRRIEALAAHAPGHRIDVVAHSMGGLAMLYYVKRLRGHRSVRKLILLGTPTAGTWAALAGVVMAPLGRASLQLLPRSGFLRDLGRGAWPETVEIISIAGQRDVIAPQCSTRLAGVRHVALPTNHSGLLVDRQAAEVVSAVLRAEKSDANAACSR
jgi:pimeloyl-ACP methyl ester carboxylesterase